MEKAKVLYHKDLETNTTTQQQKDYVLKVFAQGDLSRHWDERKKRLNLLSIASVAGISDWQVGDWYARWKFDHTTKLEPIAPTKEDALIYKKEFFINMQYGEKLTLHDTCAKYHINSTHLYYRLKKEYKEWVANGCKELIIPDVIPKTEENNNGHKQIETLYTPPSEKLNLKQPTENTIEVMDNFFNNLVEFINKLKSAEKERDFFKQKCEKWASQVVNLQNMLVKKE